MYIALYYLFKILSIVLLILAFTSKAIIHVFTNFETALIAKLKKFHIDYDLVMWVVLGLLLFLSWDSYKASVRCSKEAETIPGTYITTVAIEDVSCYDQSTNTLTCILTEEEAKKANTNEVVISWRRHIKPLDDEHPSPCYEVYESKWKEEFHVYIVYVDRYEELIEELEYKEAKIVI